MTTTMDLNNCFRVPSMIAGYSCCPESEGEEFSRDMVLLAVSACPDDDEAWRLMEREWGCAAYEPEELIGYSLARLYVRIDPDACCEEWPFEIMGEPLEGSMPVWALFGPSIASDPLEVWRGACRLGSNKPLCRQVRCAACNRSSEEVRGTAAATGYRAECPCHTWREFRERNGLVTATV